MLVPHGPLFTLWRKEKTVAGPTASSMCSLCLHGLSFCLFLVPDIYPHGEQSDAEAQDQSPALRHSHMPHCESKFFCFLEMYSELLGLNLGNLSPVPGGPNIRT